MPFGKLLIMVHFFIEKDQQMNEKIPTAGGDSEEHGDLSLLWSQFHEEQAADEPRVPDASLREVILRLSIIIDILLHSNKF